MKILHRCTHKVLFEADTPDTRSCVFAAIKDGVQLDGADLAYCDLSGANLDCLSLRFADLTGSILERADLRLCILEAASLERANLCRADLRTAGLRFANFRNAKLEGARIEWSSHDLIAEILRQAAGNSVDRLMVAGLVLIHREWCWDDFAALKGHPEFPWVVATLVPYLRPDNDNFRLRRWARDLCIPVAEPAEVAG